MGLFRPGVRPTLKAALTDLLIPNQSTRFILFLVYYPESSKYVSWVPGEAPPPRQSKFWRNVKKAFRPANFSGAEEVVTPGSEDSEFDFGASFAAQGYTASGPERARTAISEEWRTSTTYAIATVLHLAICAFVTFLLLLTLPKASQPPIHGTPDPAPGPHEESRDARVVRYWATFLGIMSTFLALFQYLVRLCQFTLSLRGSQAGIAR